jgi:hypothetical protein
MSNAVRMVPTAMEVGVASVRASHGDAAHQVGLWEHCVGLGWVLGDDFKRHQFLILHCLR